MRFSFTFRNSFTIELPLSEEELIPKLNDAFYTSRSIVHYEFDEEGFHILHKNFLPKMYNISPILFSGKVISETKDSTTVKVTGRYYTPIAVFYSIVMLTMPLAYLINILYVRESWNYDILITHPIGWPIVIYLMVFLYYQLKFNDVKNYLHRYSAYWRKQKLAHQE